MAQITKGIRHVLSMPAACSAFQNLIGAKRGRKILCQEYIRARPGEVMVDVGCGTAALLESIDPSVRYFGFDLSPAYIDAARAIYGDRGTFPRAARFLISKDRGLNVRAGDDYRVRAAPIFARVEIVRRDDMLNIPYTHAILECTK